MVNQFWESNEEMFWPNFFVSGSSSSSNFSKLSVNSDKTTPESDRAFMKADVFCFTRPALWLQLLTDETNSSNFCVRLTTEFKISFRLAKAIVPKMQAPINLQVVFFIEITPNAAWCFRQSSSNPHYRSCQSCLWRTCWNRLFAYSAESGEHANGKRIDMRAHRYCWWCLSLWFQDRFL